MRTVDWTSFTRQAPLPSRAAVAEASSTVSIREAALKLARFAAAVGPISN